MEQNKMDGQFICNQDLEKVTGGAVYEGSVQRNIYKCPACGWVTSGTNFPVEMNGIQARELANSMHIQNPKKPGCTALLEIISID